MEKQKLDQETMDWIVGQVETVKFGTVLVTIHDGQVVQIDRTEKSRKDIPPTFKHHRPKV